MRAAGAKRALDLDLHWVAVPVVAAITSMFSMGTTLVRFAYRDGADPLSVIATRQCGAFIGLTLILLALRVPFRLPRREGIIAVILGVVMGFYSEAMYQALLYMPVALAIASFYTFPLMAGLVGWITGQDRFGPRGWLALALAFGGLLVALDVFGGGLDLRGLAWGLASAAGFATVLVVTSRHYKTTTDSRPRTLVMLGAAAVVTLAAELVHGTWGGGFNFPSHPLGWFGLIMSPLCYLVAMTSLMLVLPILGAARAAVLLYSEPIFSTVFAFFILGETLHPLQVVGIVAIVAGIVVFRPVRRVPEPPPG